MINNFTNIIQEIISFNNKLAKGSTNTISNDTH